MVGFAARCPEYRPLPPAAHSGVRSASPPLPLVGCPAVTQPWRGCDILTPALWPRGFFCGLCKDAAGLVVRLCGVVTTSAKTFPVRQARPPRRVFHDRRADAVPRARWRRHYCAGGMVGASNSVRDIRAPFRERAEMHPNRFSGDHVRPFRPQRGPRLSQPTGGPRVSNFSSHGTACRGRLERSNRSDIR